jgi:hypothetical protein
MIFKDKNGSLLLDGQLLEKLVVQVSQEVYNASISGDKYSTDMQLAMEWYVAILHQFD